MAHFALPYLKKTRGCIVNISSKTVSPSRWYVRICVIQGAILALTGMGGELLGYAFA